MNVPAPFLRTGSPTPNKHDDDEEYNEWEERVRQAARRESLDGFMNAVRAKPQWFFKILEQRGLAEKWVGEAQLENGEDLSERVRYARFLLQSTSELSDLLQGTQTGSSSDLHSRPHHSAGAS
jgi:hypothetical protein